MVVFETLAHKSWKERIEEDQKQICLTVQTESHEMEQNLKKRKDQTLFL